MGLSVAKILSFKGANVVLISRSVDKLEDALKIVKVGPAMPFAFYMTALTISFLRRQGCRQRQEQAAIPLHRR
jgi:NAD(P)-dependent dehydrogenase (short-subunit alcohol dehydrogenase family)